MLMLKNIIDLLEAMRENVFFATLREIKTHTYIRGDDLTDAAAKLAVTDFDILPPENIIRMGFGSIALFPSHY